MGRVLAWARQIGRWAGRLVGALSLLLLLLVGIGPMTGRYRVATVLSASMGAAMPPGSVVFSTPEPAGRIAPGEVITFRVPDGDHRTETHRVVAVVSGGPEPVVRTRGDANAAADPWLARIDGRGPVWRARLAVPKLGYVVHALRQPLLHRLTTLLAPAMFLAAALATIWRRPAPTAVVTGDVRGA